MKKILFFGSFLFLLSFNADAQVNPHAIGLRGGSGNFGYGGEVTYQHGFGSSNRLELDIGWRGRSSNGYRAYILTGIYHWVFPIDQGFNWYIGPGAQIGAFQDKFGNEEGLTIRAGGQLGIEYDFNQLSVPFLLSLDIRPMFRFIGSSNYGFGYGGAFAIRYTF